MESTPSESVAKTTTQDDMEFTEEQEAIIN